MPASVRAAYPPLHDRAVSPAPGSSPPRPGTESGTRHRSAAAPPVGYYSSRDGPPCRCAVGWTARESNPTELDRNPCPGNPAPPTESTTRAPVPGLSHFRLRLWVRRQSRADGWRARIRSRRPASEPRGRRFFEAPETCLPSFFGRWKYARARCALRLLHGAVGDRDSSSSFEGPPGESARRVPQRPEFSMDAIAT